MNLAKDRKIHFSGFAREEKEELISKSQSLGFSIDGELTGKTDFLICKSILVEKFRIAKILNISVVSSAWILESLQQGALLDPSHFQFSIFEDLKFFLLGFSGEQATSISQIILENRGKMFDYKGNSATDL